MGILDVVTGRPMPRAPVRLAICAVVAAWFVLGAAPVSPDHVAPTVRMISPTPGAVVSEGLVVLSAGAHDNVQVVTVEFRRARRCCSFAAKVGAAVPSRYGWVFHWDTRSVRDGAWLLAAKASDAAGNTALSRPVRVTVRTPKFTVLQPRARTASAAIAVVLVAAGIAVAVWVGRPVTRSSSRRRSGRPASSRG
jgi:hypothetical protein